MAIRAIRAFALLSLLGLANVAADVCPDDPESDLCGDAEFNEFSFGHGMSSSFSLLVGVLRLSGHGKSAAVAMLALGVQGAMADTTCSELKTFYKAQQCCGSPSKVISDTLPGCPEAPSCPYNFEKPACSAAEPQTPRDLSAGATGQMTPKAATLTDAQADFLPLVNVHFHLGAEHKSDAYNNGTDAAAYDAGSSTAAVRPGWMCPTESLTASQMTSYNFQYCKGDMAVGNSYEVHYVHSSAGLDANDDPTINADNLADGLGGAANGRGILNPMIVVQGQIFQIVAGGASVDDLLHGWTVVGHTNSVMYSGSTTGTSHDNDVCSPYAITWHVDKDCHQVSPESFDNLCKQMKETYNMDVDLKPHDSRKLVSSQYVVKDEFVKPLA